MDQAQDAPPPPDGAQRPDPMTAPLLNLPIFAPAGPAGGQPAATAAGAMGFEALMAAFFATGEGETAASPFGDAEPAEGEVTEDAADGLLVASDTTPPTPVDAQTMAALLAVTPQVAAQTTPTASPDAQVQTGGAPPAAFSPLLAQEVATAPSAPAPAPTEAAEVAAPVEALEAEVPETPVAVAPTPDEVPAQAAEKPLPPGLEKPREGQITPAADHAQAKGAPPAHAAAVQAPSVPPPAPAPVAAATDPVALAEAAAVEIDPLAEPAEGQVPARPGKSDANRRNAAAPGATTAPAATVADVPAPVTALAAGAVTHGEPAVAIEGEAVATLAPREAGPDTADAPDAQGPASTAANAQQAAGPVADAPLPVRGSPETVAQLAAQIVKKLEGRSTHFDVELNPAGLGQVNVSIEIGAQGKMTAALSFDTPQAAAELRGRSGELQKALEQAGFDLSGGGLSFDVAGDRGQGRGDLYQQQQQQNEGGASRGRAFQAVLETADLAAEAAANAALYLQRPSNTGVDVRV